VWECGEEQTDRHTDTQTAVETIHSPRLSLTRNVINVIEDKDRCKCCQPRWIVAIVHHNERPPLWHVYAARRAGSSAIAETCNNIIHKKEEDRRR